MSLQHHLELFSACDLQLRAKDEAPGAVLLSTNPCIDWLSNASVTIMDALLQINNVTCHPYCCTRLELKTWMVGTCSTWVHTDICI